MCASGMTGAGFECSVVKWDFSQDQSICQQKGEMRSTNICYDMEHRKPLSHCVVLMNRTVMSLEIADEDFGNTIRHKDWNDLNCLSGKTMKRCADNSAHLFTRPRG